MIVEGYIIVVIDKSQNESAGNRFENKFISFYLQKHELTHSFQNIIKERNIISETYCKHFV